MAFPGKLGAEWDETQGYEAAKLCGLNALAQLHDAAGSLEGYVHAAPGFRGHPEVLNGASDLMNEVFGDAGRHARVALGISEMPLDAAVQTCVWAELKPDAMSHGEGKPLCLPNRSTICLPRCPSALTSREWKNFSLDGV